LSRDKTFKLDRIHSNCFRKKNKTRKHHCASGPKTQLVLCSFQPEGLARVVACSAQSCCLAPHPRGPVEDFGPRPASYATAAQGRALPPPRPGRNLGLGRETSIPPGLKEARAKVDCRIASNGSARVSAEQNPASRPFLPKP
jgi:hypothetical protein